MWKKSLATLVGMLSVVLTLASCSGVTVPVGSDAGSSKSSAKNITLFSIGDRVGLISGTDITVTLPYGTTDLNLIPTIIISAGASINPVSGIAQDFTNPVIYTVTAEDGTTKAYTVTVAVADSDSKEITAFSILDVEGTIDANTIAVTVPYGTSVTALTPTIAITGKSVSPASGEVQDFTYPVAYTVTAADGSLQAYMVTVHAELNPAKDILAFFTGDRVGAINGTDITVTLPYGTTDLNLTPTIIISAGASVSPLSGVAQDFTTPVIYTVTAADGTTKAYTVTVTVAASDSKEITAFSILDVPGIFSATNIAVTLPYGTSVTALTPSITHTGASISPVGATDFTSPVTYTVTAANGSTKAYLVTVHVALNPAKNITAFSVLDVAGTISSNNIRVTLPAGTNVSALEPTITVSPGASVYPASGVPQDFTSAVLYTVTAADGSNKYYIVTVTVVAPGKDITSFSILGNAGVISGTNITVTVPYCTDITALVPTIGVSAGATVSPPSGTVQNFTHPVTYMVIASDGTAKAYTVTVVPAAPNIYVAGGENIGIGGNGIAEYWKNGVKTALTDGTYGAWALSIFVSGADVYLAGREDDGSGGTRAVSWKNGAKTILSDGTHWAEATSMFVAGSDVYVVGYEKDINGNSIAAEYWKNGNKIALTDGTYNAQARSIFVSGSDVYVAGWDTTSTSGGNRVGVYWLNGTEVPLTNGGEGAYSIFVSGADIYVAINDEWSAAYWLNGTKTFLTDGMPWATATSIFVVGSDIYVAGAECNEPLCAISYWKNGVRTIVTDWTYKAWPTSMVVSCSDVYIAGGENRGSGGSVAEYWKNGVKTVLTDETHGSWAETIFVTP